MSKVPSRDELKEKIRSKILEWRSEPEKFAKEAFDIEVDAQQGRLLRTVVLGDCPNTAVKSGQKTGKTLDLAILGWLWTMTVEQSQVYITAPSTDVIKDGVWKEMRALHGRARGIVKAQLPSMPIDPGRGFELPGGRRCVARATDEIERLQGKSGAGQLWLIDEASGLKEEYWSAILGNLAGGGKLVAASNPTKLSGYFRDIFGPSKAGFWNRLTLRSDHTINYLSGRAAIPGLAVREVVDRIRDEFGETSLIYQVRVLGEFPSQGTDSVISLALLDRAKASWSIAAATGRLHIGVDPARLGDDESVITLVRGCKLVGLYFFTGLAGDELASEVVRIASEHKLPGEVPWIRIDENGVGSSPYDFLKSVPGLLVTGIMSGETAQNSNKFVNKRAELWFAIREWMLAGGAIPEDDRLCSELIAATYSFVGSKIRVLDKQTMKRLLKRSPDRADSLALAVYPLDQIEQDWSMGGSASDRRFGESSRDW